MTTIKIENPQKINVLTKEMRFNEIAENLDEWPEDEKLYACYYTLQQFIQTMESEQVPLSIDGVNMATARDWIANKGIREMIHNAENIREAIAMEIF